MKKLMIVAAAAVAAGAAFAEAQVLEWNLTLKSTTCKSGKASGFWTNEEIGFEKGDEISYRTSASVKLTGLTWGCYCDATLNGVWADREIQINKNDSATVWDGITFWNPKTQAFLGGVYNGSEFDWNSGGFVNLIGKKLDEVELCFGLVPSIDAVEDNWSFVLAGFGKVKHISNGDDMCDSYLASASGNVTGYMSPSEGTFNCTYCDQYGVECEVYDFCECTDSVFGSDSDKTVAFGTWKMKYNSAASKKLRSQLLITKSYSFKKGNVKDELVAAGE